MSERHGWRQAGDEVESGRGHGGGGGPHLDAAGSTQLSARCDRQQPTTQLPRPAPETGEQRGSTRRVRLGRACPQSQRALGRAVGVTAPPSSRGAVRPTPPSARGRRRPRRDAARARRRPSQAADHQEIQGGTRRLRAQARPPRTHSPRARQRGRGAPTPTPVETRKKIARGQSNAPRGGACALPASLHRRCGAACDGRRGWKHRSRLNLPDMSTRFSVSGGSKVVTPECSGLSLHRPSTCAG